MRRLQRVRRDDLGMCARADKGSMGMVMVSGDDDREGIARTTRERREATLRPIAEGAVGGTPPHRPASPPPGRPPSPASQCATSAREMKLARAREAPTTVRYEPVSGLSWRARAHLASSPSCARRHLGLQWRPDRRRRRSRTEPTSFTMARRRAASWRAPPSCADHEQPAHALRLHRLEDGAASAPRRRPRPPSLAGAEREHRVPARDRGAQRLRVPQVAAEDLQALPGHGEPRRIAHHRRDLVPGRQGLLDDLLPDAARRTENRRAS